MLAHIAKLIWNRKRANMLILTEVAITFAVLFFLIHTITSILLIYYYVMQLNRIQLVTCILKTLQIKFL